MMSHIPLSLHVRFWSTFSTDDQMDDLHQSATKQLPGILSSAKFQGRQLLLGARKPSMAGVLVAQL
jgi:hypothetical protein